MTKLADLRAQRDTVAKKVHDLNNKYPTDQRMPAAEAGQLDTFLAEVEAIDIEIARENRIAQLAGETSEGQHALALAAATRPGGAQTEETTALRAMLSGGLSALSDDQRRSMRARVSPDIRAAMSTTTGSEGGYTVAPEFSTTLIQAMKAAFAVRSVATQFQTATGAQLPFPTADATSEEGEIVGQNAAVTKQDTSFGLVSLDVYKYSSKSIALPFELIQDSFFNIESYIQNLLQLRLGRIQNRHHTLGTGTGQPRGLVPAAGAGKVGATGQTVTITYDDLVDLEHSVDPYYRPAGKWMMNDDTLRILRKVKDPQGRPIFVPGYETGNAGGAPDRLLGREIVINQHMPVMAANAKSVLFGDFSKYMVRDVMDFTLFRMTDSKYTENGQVGFLAFCRSGANLIDVGGAVKYYQNSAT
ncbi:phage major capsid protein [Massilia aurea]|jgi:HK97 family phage major capsid protein|uniref:phage major capsid protein n=1 Tax=Massilia aurea TaxID=373040 RepID=UPI002163F7E8|nr:phage major capsid protein [Massilia aurea]MCS0709466.1 phage major capsid protein [Massilia aurea]